MIRTDVIRSIRLAFRVAIWNQDQHDADPVTVMVTSRKWGLL